MTPENGDDGLLTSAAAAMKVQKVYRSYRTRRRLADSAIVAAQWWQALEFAELNRNTVSFFDFMKPETAGSRWNRVGSNASKVGKGLSKDAKAQKLAFQHWLEAIDPRHRYGHCLHIYYDEWCRSSAGQPFFYWLDVGEGREVDLKECPRSKLRKQCIRYLGPQEREHYEYVVTDGKILHKLSGKSLDTSEGSPGSKWIFVMSTSKELYIGEKMKGRFHHSSFLAGGTTIAAGRLVVEDGILKYISAYSGHYRPSDDRLDSFLSFLTENGVTLDEVEIIKANEDYEGSGYGKSVEGLKECAKPALLSNLTNGEDPYVKIDDSLEKSAEAQIPERKPEYQRTLSGGLRSPKADVPRTAILQRINSKKSSKSYQLGHQLALKWSTGAGPRIGCIADYPVQLRLQALELTHLSPRTCSSSSSLLTPRNGDAPLSPSSLGNEGLVESA